MIIAVVYLGKQEQAFRGHNESADSLNKGNSVELVESYCEVDPASSTSRISHSFQRDIKSHTERLHS